MPKYFSDTLNVLSNISKVKEFPFPYAGSFGCFPEEVYNALAKTRPDWKSIVSGRPIENNRRMDIQAHNLLKGDLHPLWRDFTEYHTSKSFYHKILDHFESYFMQYHPRLKNMRDYKTGIRFSGEEADIYLDCQLSINTPVTEKSTVNHPHVDNPLELWASLLYMKEPDDNAGGNLVLHKCVKPPTFHPKREADLDCIRPVLQIPYSPNVYTCFVNSPMSIHSVTEREVTEKARLMVNISLEFEKEPLFDVQ